MAGGWARDGAVNEQIEVSIADELKRIPAHLRDFQCRIVRRNLDDVALDPAKAGCFGFFQTPRRQKLGAYAYS